MNQEIENQIKNNITWSKLPTNVKQVRNKFKLINKNQKIINNFFDSSLEIRKKNMKKQCRFIVSKTSQDSKII